MIAAAAPRARASDARLLVVDRSRGTLVDARATELGVHARPGDVFVLNDAATLPASLEARGPRGEPMELRLVAPAAVDARRWTAVLFGSGDWRMRTEDRPPPPVLAPGDTLDVGAMHATVRSVSSISARLVDVEVDRAGAAFWSALYRVGRPVQYSYAARPLALDEVQTSFASRPWAVEMPSAGRPLTASVRASLLARGARIATLTHAAGLSATGDPALDAALPLPERYELPAATVRAIASARAHGGRVVAVGTTVARALEGNARTHGGSLEAGTFVTDLVLGPSTHPIVVDALLTGAHEPGTSHFGLLRAFADDPLLARVIAHAEAHGHELHEFGDAWLLA